MFVETLTSRLLKTHQALRSHLGDSFNKLFISYSTKENKDNGLYRLVIKSNNLVQYVPY